MKTNSKESRRDFIKSKIGGGLAGLLGLSLVSWSSIEKSKRGTVPLFKGEEVDWLEVKNQFSLNSGRYHFRTASLGPSPRVVVDTVVDKMRELEALGQNRHDFIKPVRDKIATFLNISADQIGMVTNTTEAMNIVARTINLKAGDEVVISVEEHIGGAAPWLALQKEKGIIIKLVELDASGKDNLRVIKTAISDRTKVVVISHITCTTGLVLPVAEIAKYCRKKGVLSCIDGAQALGMVSVDLHKINPDFYVSSGHKWLFGPKGTGIVYMKKSILESTDPFYAGAYADTNFDLTEKLLEFKHTADRYEVGTRNTPITLGLGAAIDFVSAIGIHTIEKRGKELATYFKNKIVKHEGIQLLTPMDEDCTAAIVTIRLAGVENVVEKCSLLMRDENLFMRGIYENNINGIRLAFAVFNTKKEIDHAVEILKKQVR